MSLKRQTMWSVVPLLVVSVVGFFSVPLFYRYLGDQMYALWGYVATFTGMFGFADLGLGVAVGRYVGLALGKGDQAAAREYWGTGNLIALPLLGLMTLLFMVLGVVFGPQWFNISPEDVGLLRACFIVGGVSLFLNYYGQLWVVLLQTHLDFKFTSLLRVVIGLVQVVPAVFIAYYTHNPLYVGLWSLPVGFLQLALLVRYSRRQYQVGFSLRAACRSRAREMAGFTGKTFASLVVGSLFVQMDRLVAGRFAVAADYSHYLICTNVGMRLQGLGGAVMGPVFHNTTRGVGNGRASSPALIYDEMFNFMFGWYLLAALWVAVWHPVLLRLWLDLWRGSAHEVAASVAPLFTPIIVAYCISAMASISGAQLSALNRMGAACGFIAATGLLTLAGVWLGWHFAGVIGVAYGFLASRMALIAQDLFVIRLIQARGWLAARTWSGLAGQGVVACLFALPQFFMARASLWNLIPAALHGGLVAAWLLRRPLRQMLDRAWAEAPPLAATELQPPGV